MSDLRVSLVQTALHWEDPEANRTHFQPLIAPLAGQTDVVVLPEMFSTGFSMAPERLAEDPEGATTAWMAQQAKQLDAVVTGSVITRDRKGYYNRLIWMQPDGTFSTYDKRHLFRFAGEDGHYQPGSDRLIVNWRGWRICPLVCYDLRFPVWSRNRPLHGQGEAPVYDALLYVANWPEARRHPWSALLVARAIENQCYVVGVNRIGADGNGIDHSGDSVALDPKGQPISTIEPGTERVETVSFSRSELERFRQKFPVSLDGDDFRLI